MNNCLICKMKQNLTKEVKFIGSGVFVITCPKCGLLMGAPLKHKESFNHMDTEMLKRAFYKHLDKRGTIKNEINSGCFNNDHMHCHLVPTKKGGSEMLKKTVVALAVGALLFCATPVYAGADEEVAFYLKQIDRLDNSSLDLLNQLSNVPELRGRSNMINIMKATYLQEIQNIKARQAQEIQAAKKAKEAKEATKKDIADKAMAAAKDAIETADVIEEKEIEDFLEEYETEEDN